MTEPGGTLILQQRGVISLKKRRFDIILIGALGIIAGLAYVVDSSFLFGMIFQISFSAFSIVTITFGLEIFRCYVAFFELIRILLISIFFKEYVWYYNVITILISIILIFRLIPKHPWRVGVKDAQAFRDRYGSYAVVCGATGGMGAAYCHELASLGLNLIMVGRREEKLKALHYELEAQFPNIKAEVLVADISDEEDVWRILKEASTHDVGLFIYHAAYGALFPFVDDSIENIMQVIHMNCFTFVRMLHHFSRKMLNQKHSGGILITSSMSARQGMPLITTYNSTKAFQWIMGEGLWEELRCRGIDVCSVLVGATRTPSYVQSIQFFSKEKEEKIFRADVMTASEVVHIALTALEDRRPMIIPGKINNIVDFVCNRILPRKLALKLIEKQVRGMFNIFEEKRVSELALLKDDYIAKGSTNDDRDDVVSKMELDHILKNISL